MMTEDEKRQAIANERSAESRYMKALRDKSAIFSTIAGAANSFWTGSGRPKRQRPVYAQFVGRVALMNPDHEILDGASEFYIGEAHSVFDGVQVYSWTADIARTFFRGTGDYYLCDDVAATRSFTHRLGQIADLVDEVLHPGAPPSPFKRRNLSVPKMDGGQSISFRSGAKSKAKNALDESAPAVPPSLPTSPTSTAPPTVSRPIGIRAEPILRAKLEAPRTESLEPVLATLQPDQYELVTVPAMESRIIEGQPGSGKTIVASHRAAFLVHPHTSADRTLDGKVLLVGPTAGYSKHVRGVINTLATERDRIIVLSLDELLLKLRGSKVNPEGPASEIWQDAAAELGRVVRDAIARGRESRGADLNAEHVYGSFLTEPWAERDPELRNYLNMLPTFGQALRRSRFVPLLAYIKVVLEVPDDLRGIEHIIVDEAQDVTGLEWTILEALNEANQWTILGDLNQRRSDHTLSSWAQIIELAKPGSEPRVQSLKRCYRSTRPILKYANRLLAKEHRDVDAFRVDGPEPKVVQAKSKEVGATALASAERLLHNYPNGTVAAICTEPEVVKGALRKTGWRAESGQANRWVKDGRAMAVLHHDDARGIEFDGVVVVEPADFPRYFDKNGPLYTALTRANRELVVVHTKPLPEKLRPRRSDTTTGAIPIVPRTLERPDSAFPNELQQRHIRRLLGDDVERAEQLIGSLSERNLHHAVCFEIAKLEGLEQD